MLNAALRRVLPLVLFCWPIASGIASAQVFTIPTNPGRFTSAVALDAIQTSRMEMNIFLVNNQDPNVSPLETPSGSISNLDLKAPRKARREYEKGYQLLMRKDTQAAIEQLTNAIAIYPSFVAAHNTLGNAYLILNENEQARAEFAKAAELDDHLPNSYLNLGCAHLALKNYAEAEDAFRKASTIAPLDLHLQTALAYGAFMNHDYSGVLATAQQVHERKHTGAAIVHFFAAGALQAQDKSVEARREMETLLQEDPKSASAPQFRQMLEDMKADEAKRAEAKLHPVEKVTFTFDTPAEPSKEEASRQAQQILQNIKEKNQIAEAEAAPDPTCVDCDPNSAVGSARTFHSEPSARQHRSDFPGTTFRSSVDEVALFFAATDHGRAVTDLVASDIELRDASQAPGAILDFRNEAQLPLRLGLVIDTSNSVTNRFSFEQKAAARFLQTVMVNPDDLAFVVGVNNSVLLVQDFTADQMLISHAVNQLAPGGGTAMWDAIAFAADKLASRAEIQPVARILVVISDGNDNSSSSTLKQAIGRVQRHEVAVYTVSTREAAFDAEQPDFVGDHALAALSELTGGAAFVPGSVRRLNGSLADLQQVIRSRYLVSYKPASFQRDGRYRAVDIKAQKDGHPLKVFARKGYYASATQADSSDR